MLRERLQYSSPGNVRISSLSLRYIDPEYSDVAYSITARR